MLVSPSILLPASLFISAAITHPNFIQILDTYQGFATESEKDEISNKLQQTEDWLYEDGDDESAAVYAERLQDLIKVISS